MRYDYHQFADILYTVDAPNIKRNTCNKIFPFSLPFLGVKNTNNEIVNGVQMVTIFHIETFEIFDFDPSLIYRLITYSNLDRMK